MRGGGIERESRGAPVDGFKQDTARYPIGFGLVGETERQNVAREDSFQSHLAELPSLPFSLKF